MNNDDKQALIDNIATIPFNINIIKDGNIVKTLTESNIINIHYEDFRYVDTSSLVVGQFVARKVTGVLDKVYDDFNIENTELELQLGVAYDDKLNYYSLGNFLVTKPSSDDVKDKLQFEALDYTKKFNQPFDATNITYPCTALQLAQAICEQCGVVLGNDDFTNHDFLVTSNQYVEGESCRDVMKDIGKLAYSWVRIGWDNKCYIDFTVENAVDNYNKIPSNKYYTLNKQEDVFGPVNRIVIGLSNIEGENVVIEDESSIAQNGVTELQIYDNLLTYTPELREQVKQSAAKLFGLTYLPLEITTVGHPWLIGKEKIEVIDNNSNSYYTYPFDRYLEYQGHIKSKLTSKADTKIETEYKNTNTLDNNIKKTRIIIDKELQEIKSIVEENIDLVREASGTPNITTERANEGYLLDLNISGNVIPYFPHPNLFPSETFYTKPSDFYLKVTNEDGTEFNSYKLPFKYLGTVGDVKDEFEIDNQGNAKLIRRVGINANAELYVLDEEEIIDYTDLIHIKVFDGINHISFNYYTPTIKIKYALKNDLTNTFATKIDVGSEIKQTKDEINLEVRKKVDEDEIIASINLSSEDATINANKISLEGKTIALTSNNIEITSDNFSVDTEGNMSCNNGNFSGNITSSTISLQDEGRISGGTENRAEISITNSEEDYRTKIWSNAIKIDDMQNLFALINISQTGGTIGIVPYANSLQGSVLDYSKNDEAILRLAGNNYNIVGNVSDNECYLRLFDYDTLSTTNITPEEVRSPRITQSSLESMKKNFEKMTTALEIINNTDIYKFNYKGENDTDKKHIGLVIGENYNYSKELTNNENNAADLYSMIGVCFQAIKEQQEQIEILQKEINKLKEERQ